MFQIWGGLFLEGLIYERAYFLNFMVVHAYNELQYR